MAIYIYIYIYIVVVIFCASARDSEARGHAALAEELASGPGVGRESGREENKNAVRANGHKQIQKTKAKSEEKKS